MKSLLTLSTAVLVAPWFAVPAFAQTDQTASLLDALSLLSGRMLVAPMAAPQVTRDGDRFRVRIPLPNLTTPPDAAIEVTATPLDSGVWDITGLTFPQTGTLVGKDSPDNALGSVRFTIGQQTAHARVDPTLSIPSPYAAAFSDIALHFEDAAPGKDLSAADLAIGQITVDGTITGDRDKRMTTRSHGRGDNLRLTASSRTGGPFAMSIKSVEARYDVDGLDRAQADRLREATRAISTNRKAMPSVPGQPPSMSPAIREQLHAMVEASVGLMSGFNVEETFQGLHFQAPGGHNGDIGEIHVAMESDTGNNHVAGHFDIGLTNMTLTTVPAQYVPRRINIKTAIAGIPAEALRRLLRSATEANADFGALSTQAIALLNEPGAHVGIDTLLIESGPLLVQGSARVRALPDGSPAIDIHLTAHGLDAMLALVQADPKAQQVMPMLFMAKGMGKPEGDTVVWDIAYANGIPTINGVPMGQNAGGGEAGVRPPKRR
jgi:hypothetical protein